MRRLMQNLTRLWRYKKLFKLFNRFWYHEFTASVIFLYIILASPLYYKRKTQKNTKSSVAEL